jgi:hypothetical protein
MSAPLPQGIIALGQRISEAARSAGVSRSALGVLAPRNDPYTLDTPNSRRAGQWFAEALDRFGQHGRSLHLRGLHYLLSSSSLTRPDGTPYKNDDDCWLWLSKAAAKAARWLGYVDWDRIHDARNDDPILEAAEPGDDDDEPSVIERLDRTLHVRRGSSYAIDIPDTDDLLPSIYVASSGRPRQAYRLGLIGEKSSLRPVIEPFATQYQMDVVLDTGDASDSHLYQMAKRAAADGRPFVCFYLSDCDPGGHNMPVSAARKFQALRDLLFPDLNMRLYPVALTPEQCDEYDLPSAPLKEGEARKDQWRARFGREQTELDALMALRPGVLEALLHAAIKPFFDPTLDRRYRQATATPRRVRQWFEALPEYREAVREIGELHDVLDGAAAELIDAVNRHGAAVGAAVENTDDAPRIEPVRIGPNLPLSPPEPLFDSRDDWTDATRKLQAYRNGDDDAEEATS